MPKLVRLALPVYIELLTAVVAVGLIDTFWVSGLGSEAVSAVTIATTTEHLALGAILALTTGTTVLIGRRDGTAPLGPLIGTSWGLWAAYSVAVPVPGVLLREPLARLFTDDAATAGLAADFYLVSLAGLPAFFAQTLVDGVFKGLGDTRTPMRTALLCNGLVIALDPLLIYGLDLGVPGAALATVLARTVSLAVAIALLVRRLRRRPRRHAARDARQGGTNLREAATILRTGLPMSVDFLARSLVGMVMAGIVGGHGVAALAGYGIGLKIMLAGTMVFYALRQAAMISTARTDGDGAAAGSALRLGLAAGLGTALLLNLSASPLIGLFSDDPAVTVEAVWFLRCMTLYLVPFGGLIAMGGVLQASGKGGRLLAATLAGFAVQLPLAYSLSRPIGITGVWLAMAAGATLTLAAMTVRRAWREPYGAGRERARGRGPRSTRTAEGPRSCR
ncbi:MATE family efflux transporter [Sphaerimonospora thailandensis]|uniref:Probable multidrug resistance protein NorM n=1 Tax=Sphaerimonospora thailandensis TaxID=795644 RepID=A0A8J3R9S6_9ACTN|nr:MATE family efflux transporter [Sphaerimonospora thailandensis]GIH70664.1 multidrug resistance protein, MATE family [Sphaerimonospora thailandensis]